MKQALDIIKANMIALSCAVIALVAIVAIFVWPIPGIFETLRGEVAARKQVSTDIETLTNAPRTLPNVDPANSEAVPLNGFPTKPVIAEGKAAIQKVKDGSKSVLDAAVKSNARQPLVPGILPKTDSISRGKFRDEYVKVTAQYGEHVNDGIIHTVLHGTLPPTAEELAAADAARTSEIQKALLQTNNMGVAQNGPQVEAELATMRAKLPMQQRVSRAMNNQIYVSPGAVEIHPDMDTIGKLNDVSVFNAQFSLWLQTTVLEAIANANRNAKNVLDAPVKHLLSLRVPMNMADPNVAAQSVGFGAPAEAPAAATVLASDASGTITPKYEVDPLGYASNSMYDAIRIQLVLRIDATRLSESIAALSQNHLIKVRNVNFRTVSAGSALTEGFYYSKDGKAALVEVELDCDVLILRAWLVPYMPDPVKTVFSQLANPTVAP